MAGTDNIPVDIEFVFKSLNVDKQTEKIKKEIIDVGATTDKVSEQVEANFTEAFTKASAEAAKTNLAYSKGAAGAAAFAKGNNQLSYSIQQVARELPSLAISPQMFFLAISNNLPILQDNIRKVRLENEALKASGASTVPVWKTLAKSLFSWQTALVAGITILTVYWKDIFKAAKNLFSFGEAAKFTKKEQQKLTGEIQKESLALNQLIGKIKNTNTGTKDRAKAIKQVNDKYGDYLDNLLTEKSTLQDIETAQKNATKALIADISIKQNREKLDEISAGISDNFGKNFSGFIEKFGQTYGVDRISDFVTAINDAVDEQIKTGGGKIERGILEYSNIAKKVYDEFIAEISQKTGYVEYSFKDFQDSFLDFAEFKADKLVFINTLQGMIDSYQGILDGLKTNDKGRTVDVINQEIAALQKLQKEQAKTASEYKNYQNQIDALVKERAAITGEKTGDNNYDEYYKQLKDKEDRLSALRDLADKELEIRQNLEQSKIDAMNEGFEKQRAQAKAAYEQELADIDKQGRDYLAKLNESKGFSVSDDGYITELPAEVQASLNAQKENAARQYANEIVAINADAATTIKEIWADATQESMSDLDKELASIDDYYNKLKKQAEEAGRTDLVPSIDDKRLKARAQAIADSNVKIIENEQELEEKRNEIAATGATNETKWQVKSLETKIKYAEKKLEVVRKLQTKESQYQAQALELEIELYQQMINKIEFESKLANLEESLDVLTQMVNKYSEYLDLSEEQVDVLNNGATALSGVMDIAKGDYLSGGVKVVTAMVDTLISAQDNLTEEIKESVSAMMDLADGAETAADAISNITFDSSGSIAYLKFLQESIISLTDDAKALNEEITYDRYGRRGEESSNVLRSVYSGYREELAELNAEIEELSTQILSGGLSPEHMEAAEAILNAYSELQDRMSSIEEDLIGTSVNDLADSLAEAFLAGEDAAEAWGEKVDDIIQKVIIDQLTAQLLTEPIQKAVDQLIVDMNDGDTTGRTQTDPGLTVDEAQDFKDSVLDILESAGPAFDAVRDAYEAAGFSFSSDDSESGYDELTGITQSLTEETGSLLVGQFMSIRTDIKSILAAVAQDDEIVQQRLVYLKGIRDNTGVTASEIVEVKNELKTMNKTLESRL